jgi:hypothetical protein
MTKKKKKIKTIFQENAYFRFIETERSTSEASILLPISKNLISEKKLKTV